MIQKSIDRARCLNDSLEEPEVVRELRDVRDVGAVEGGALERDLEVVQRRVHVVVLVEQLVRLRNVRLQANLQL